jgi:hypothetical protein
VDAATVAVTFSGNVTASDYTLGVTIEVDDVEETISSGTRQTNHALVYYVLSAPVTDASVVTWAYAKASGSIVAETGGAALEDVTAQTVINNVSGLPQVASATLLLDLQADMLALADGDPVATWADQSGNGRDFSQTGDARPTYHTASPSVDFAGIAVEASGNWLDGSNFANDPPLAFFIVAKGSNAISVFKIGNWQCDDPGCKGWTVSAAYVDTFGSLADQFSRAAAIQNFPSQLYVACAEIISYTELHNWLNGVLNDDSPGGGDSFGNGVSDFSNSEIVRLNVDGSNGDCQTPSDANATAIMIYQITDLANWPTDRAAITAWLTTRYGVTLPS